jgi:hypothetical protein
MQTIQFTLRKDVYKDPDRLGKAIEKLKSVGAFVALDTRYAARIGVLSGQLPDDRVAAVEQLDVVSALQRDHLVRALA